MSTVYDTRTRQSHIRRAVDSAELLVRSRVMRARAMCFAVGFVGALVLCWISKGVA